MNAVDELNVADSDAAAAGLGQCCASRRWVADVLAGRPYADLPQLVAASGAALGRLSWADVSEALEAHPRIGRAATGADRESGWSRQEQAGAATATDDVKTALAAGNLAYEQQFGHVYLICATGLSAADMLAALNRRLGNSVGAERSVVAAELAKIVALRLGKAYQ